MESQKRIQRGAQAFGFEFHCLNFQKGRVCNIIVGSIYPHNTQVCLDGKRPRQLMVPLLLGAFCSRDLREGAIVYYC